MRFEDLVKYLKRKYDEGFLDDITGIILRIVEDEAERVIGLKISECLDRELAKLNTKKLEFEEALNGYKKIVDKCTKEARRSVLKN